VRAVRPHRPAVERLDLGVEDGRFALIAPTIPVQDAVQVYDAQGRLGFPGVVDAHTHVGIYAPLADDAVTESGGAVSGGLTTPRSAGVGERGAGRRRAGPLHRAAHRGSLSRPGLRKRAGGAARETAPRTPGSSTRPHP
jgi:N-acyl-D-aspartate/D-glutamate deacylase